MQVVKSLRGLRSVSRSHLTQFIWAVGSSSLDALIESGSVRVDGEKAVVIRTWSKMVRRAWITIVDLRCENSYHASCKAWARTRQQKPLMPFSSFYDPAGGALLGPMYCLRDYSRSIPCLSAIVVETDRYARGLNTIRSGGRTCILPDSQACYYSAAATTVGIWNSGLKGSRSSRMVRGDHERQWRLYKKSRA